MEYEIRPDNMTMQEGNENEVCNECKLPRPENYAADQDLVWIGCDVCEKWFHVVCVGMDPETDVTGLDYTCTSCNSNNRNERGFD